MRRRVYRYDADARPTIAILDTNTPAQDRRRTAAAARRAVLLDEQDRVRFATGFDDEAVPRSNGGPNGEWTRFAHGLPASGRDPASLLRNGAQPSSSPARPIRNRRSACTACDSRPARPQKLYAHPDADVVDVVFALGGTRVIGARVTPTCRIPMA